MVSFYYMPHGYYYYSSISTLLLLKFCVGVGDCFGSGAISAFWKFWAPGNIVCKFGP